MIETGTGHYYYLDLDKVNQWIHDEKNSKPVIETETVRDDKNKVVQTIETKTNYNSQYSNLRYDMFHGMLESLYNLGAESEENAIKFIQDPDQLSISSKIILNTFIENGFMLDKLKTKK